MLIDNQAMQTQVEKGTMTSKSRHVDIASKFIFQQVNDFPYALRLHYIKSEYNIADIGTKPLARVKYEKFRNLLMGHAPERDASVTHKSDATADSEENGP